MSDSASKNHGSRAPRVMLHDATQRARHALRSVRGLCSATGGER
jgi:hypothetical protein